MSADTLWDLRWPSIAKQECVDIVEAGGGTLEVRFSLPCAECELKSACLNAKRKEMGPLMYSREIQTKPVTGESSLFSRDLFEPLLLKDAACTPFWNKPAGGEERYAICTAWDIAWSESIGADYLVKISGVVDRVTGVRQVLDLQRWRGKRFTEQMEMMETSWKMWHDDLVVVETDVQQIVWVQWLEEKTAMPVIGHTSGGKRDLMVGVPSLLMELETQKWRFPYRRDARGFDEIENFLSEAENFGWKDGKLEGVGEHDDTVMAWWHLSWGFRKLLGLPTAN